MPLSLLMMSNMGDKNYIIVGFGDAGALTQKSLEDAEAQSLKAEYFGLSGTFQDLERPSQNWEQLKLKLESEDEAFVIWSDDSLIIWDRMTRALAINHQPDFLWPLSIELENGALKPVTTHLFKAVGASEIALFGFRALKSFHHCVSARALYKLLDVTDTKTLTLTQYLTTSWNNFESVKAPDAWIIAYANNNFSIENLSSIGHRENSFRAAHSNWLMGREALEARTRNTMAAADFCRANIDIMGAVMDDLMVKMPYYGFWPIKAGHNDAMMQPVMGYHPAIAQAIWAGEYCKTALDFFIELFCRGTFRNILDVRHDHHIFGLVYAKITGITPSLLAHNIEDRAVSKTTAMCNNINVNIIVDAPELKENVLIICDINEMTDYIGACDVLVPLSIIDDRSKISIPQLSDNYTALTYDTHKMGVTPLTDIEQVKTSAGLIIIHNDHLRKLGTLV